MLVGTWPLDLDANDAAHLAKFRDRILGWRQKALREAKLRTSWLDPNEAYEAADADFIRTILAAGRSPEFLDSLSTFVWRIAAGGALNGLVQTALRCTAPGVPDCYQGCEFWDFSLVDPDNRRPVDYGGRIAATLEQKTPSELLANWQDGQIKQSLIADLLSLRRQRQHLFSNGEYLALSVRGERSDNVLAFARVAGGDALIFVAPLHCASRCTASPSLPPDFWADTTIEIPEHLGRAWRQLFDDQFSGAGASLPCRDLFAHFPVAALI
jgi:(1->4)-alpha-D-glucan 1-alpha-D-glucosylmutase